MSEKIHIKSKFRPKKQLMIFLIAIAIIIIGFIAYEMSKYQSTDDAYVETVTVSVAPKVSGEIVEVLVEDNKPVKAGAVVARIDKRDYIVAHDKAKALNEKALLNQQNANASLKAANAEIELAQTDVDRYKKLYAAGAVSKQTLDNAETKLEAAKAKLTNAEQALFSKDNSNVADADLAALKAQMDQAALAHGMVKNMPVEIKIDAIPGKVFKGKIDTIQKSSGAKASLFPPENAVGSFVKIVQRVPVKILFDEDISGYTLLPGLSVVTKIKTK